MLVTNLHIIPAKRVFSNEEDKEDEVAALYSRNLGSDAADGGRR
jgi:hypothetical protein